MNRDFTTDAQSLTTGFSRRTAIIGIGAAAAALALGTTASGANAQEATPTPGGAGLGLTRADWEAKYGKGEVGQGAMIYDVADRKAAVFMDGKGKDARVWSIFFALSDDTHGVPEDEALAKVGPLLPADAVLVETFSSPGAGIAPRSWSDLYNSPSLKGAYSENFSATGDFMVAYGRSGELPDGNNVVTVSIYVAYTAGHRY